MENQNNVLEFTDVDLIAAYTINKLLKQHFLAQEQNQDWLKMVKRVLRAKNMYFSDYCLKEYVPGSKGHNLLLIEQKHYNMAQKYLKSIEFKSELFIKVRGLSIFKNTFYANMTEITHDDDRDMYEDTFPYEYVFLTHNKYSKESLVQDKRNSYYPYGYGQESIFCQSGMFSELSTKDLIEEAVNTIQWQKDQLNAYYAAEKFDISYTNLRKLFNDSEINVHKDWKYSYKPFLYFEEKPLFREDLLKMLEEKAQWIACRWIDEKGKFVKLSDFWTWKELREQIARLTKYEQANQ